MDLNELLVDPTGVQTWRLGESELLISTTELSQRICELEALRLRMVTDLDTRATAKTLGASNTAAWLSGATRMSRVRLAEWCTWVGRSPSCRRLPRRWRTGESALRTPRW